jgi:hypothetical protein
MAVANHHKVIALFDVDGTLTVPRKVLTLQGLGMQVMTEMLYSICCINP